MRTLLPVYYVIIQLVICPSVLNSQTYRGNPNPDFIDELLYKNEELQAAKDDVKNMLQSKQQNVNISLYHSSKLNNQCELANSSLNFYIKADSQNVDIYGSMNPYSYINGLYYYLHQVGVRFFNYSKEWTYIPSKISLPNLELKFVERKFESIDFFGTGGTGKDYLQKQNLEQYKIRNGFYGNITGVAHSFNRFYQDNKEVIDSNPTILSDYATTKHDPNLDHPKTLPLIKEWIEKKLRENRNEHQYHIAVSPADGLSNEKVSKPSQYPFIKNYSDKYTWIASEVSKHIEQVFPNYQGYISYNVYGNGKGSTKAPDFTIHDKVHLQLIPYAFQRDYNTAEEMIVDWQLKHPKNPKSIYDYWNITQWSEGLPNGGLYDKVKNKLPFWERQDLNGLRLETTHFTGATAPHLWVLSQYVNGYSSKSVDSLYSEFYTKAFGKGAKDIEKMYQRWSTNFTGESELPFTFQDLSNAYSKVKNEAEKKRIEQLMAYAHWMRLHFEAKRFNTPSKALELERYAKLIRPLSVTQSYTVWRYNYGNVKPYGFGGSSDNWEDFNDIVNFEQLRATILRNFQNDLKRYPLKFSFSKLTPEQSITTKPEEYKAVKLKTYSSASTSYLFKPQKDELYEFLWTASHENDLLVINDGKESEKKYTVSSIDESQIAKVYVKKGQTYTVTYQPSNHSSITYTLPANTVFFYKEGRFPSSNRYNTWYLYVPKDISNILIKPFHKDGYTTKQGITSAIFYPTDDGYQLAEPKSKMTNTHVKKYIEDYDGTYKISIPPGKEGKVWLVKMRVDKWEIINFSPLMSKTKFSVEHD